MHTMSWASLRFILTGNLYCNAGFSVPQNKEVFGCRTCHAATDICLTTQKKLSLFCIVRYIKAKRKHTGCSGQ
jgi:hypothetical protein